VPRATDTEFGAQVFDGQNVVRHDMPLLAAIKPLYTVA
jgi:hypothetical protein